MALLRFYIRPGVLLVMLRAFVFLLKQYSSLCYETVKRFAYQQRVLCRSYLKKLCSTRIPNSQRSQETNCNVFHFYSQTLITCKYKTGSLKLTFSGKHSLTLVPLRTKLVNRLMCYIDSDNLSTCALFPRFFYIHSIWLTYHFLSNVIICN